MWHLSSQHLWSLGTYSCMSHEEARVKPLGAHLWSSSGCLGPSLGDSIPQGRPVQPWRNYTVGFCCGAWWTRQVSPIGHSRSKGALPSRKAMNSEQLVEMLSFRRKSSCPRGNRFTGRWQEAEHWWHLKDSHTLNHLPPQLLIHKHVHLHTDTSNFPILDFSLLCTHEHTHMPQIYSLKSTGWPRGDLTAESSAG